MKSVLITGTSSGFGREVAATLAGRGWRVFASMRDTGNADRVLGLAESMRAPTSAIHVVPLDVASEDSRALAVKNVLEITGGRLDAVVHNAGYSTTGFFEDLAPQQIRHIVETNLLGAMDLTQRLLPALREASGRIAVVSSNAVNVPHPMFSVYAATKWALEGWCEALAIELGPFGVDVVVFQPGNHDTGFGEHAVPVLPEASPYADLARRAIPRLSGLARYSRPSRKASQRMCDVLESSRPRLRIRIGADDVVASWLARVTTYGLRRRGIEWMTDLGR
ncbi:SDR family oxidoreductase [Nocardia sp. CA2R105]|uniref:SDR family oxidoreductase n=1 Tax=Nocardia coffeae TaxID=2873381 RepID=UPI001CA6A458|nr:SDR family oxidoreductase [Nocardia coffeae]MBY8856836.1 SDR family oxidoreductase [Nocardia coffeae]